MSDKSDLTLRAARPGDGAHYSPAQIEGWMGARTPACYEELIARGNMVVAEQAGVVVGFVDAEPGEVTRLFLVPEAAGAGLGARLLEIGPIKVEAPANAEGFYRRHGFRPLGKGWFSHGTGGDPIEIVHMEL